MARTLELQYGKHRFAREIAKIDRTKLYGDVDVETLDADGKPCKLATLAQDGKTLIPYGGTAFGYVNADGEWIDRGDLVPVDANGNRMNEMPSSFSAPVEIDDEVDLETFLDHSVRLCYRLEIPDGDAETPGELPDAMRDKLAEGAIFRIDFSYRGGVTRDVAFILEGEQGSLWMLVASENDISWVGLEQAAMCGTSQVDEDEEKDDDEGDGLDFGML